MKISFEAFRDKSVMINPRKGFTSDEIPFEIRYDPLTGETGRVFDLPFQADKPDLDETVRRSREIFCPFCPENIEKSTGLFPKELIPEGRIEVGESTLIPNLIPFDKYAGVSIFSRRHYVPIEDLTPETMRDAFIASLRFIRSVADYDEKIRCFTLNWNYLPPAGSSMVHPHLQPNCGEVPTNQLRLQLEGSRRYFMETGRNFWLDYVEVEKKLGERYLGEIGDTCWVMNFVPLGFLPDVTCIFPQKVSLALTEDSEIAPFLKGLAAILGYFRTLNIFSFNVSIFSVREDQGFRMNGRICPRLFPRAIGNNDMAYLQVLHNEPFTVRRPETVCGELKRFFE
jgi:galactose-1-phosphate uridylyltransferase